MLTSIQISKDNLLHNFNQFRSYIDPSTQLVSVVKGNAYGHGQDEIVSILDPVTDYFAVITIDDLRRLRKISLKPTLILGYIEQFDLEEALLLDGTLCVYDMDRLYKLNKLAEKLHKHPKVHVKVDAALGRQGVLPDSLAAFFRELKTLSYIEVEGMYAHFANIEDTTDSSHAHKQIELFNKAKEIAKQEGYPSLITHISSTAATLVYEKTDKHNNLVRIGLGLYGMWPSVDIRREYRDTIELKPVLRWVTKVAQVKTLPSGFTVGYGLTYVTTKKSVLAVIPQGYADGYDRGLSNIGEVLIRGTRCQVRGRIAMNMFVVDVSHIPDIKAEEEVVLIGSQGTEIISAEEIAEKLNTINYEITTRISSLLPRVII